MNNKLAQYDYQNKVFLAKGTFGFAFKIFNLKDKKYYVLKQIFFKELKDDEINLIQNEINILKSINHENIVKYIDSFKEKDSYSIIMEFCDNLDLLKYIQNVKEQKKFIEPNAIYIIIKDICLGLKEIHENNLIHRDIKPDNIFIGEDYKIKIGDFGSSKKLNETLHAKTFAGTINYMAPEIIKGENYTNKVDIWSLGCIIYELCTLNLCFEYDSYKGLINKILKGEHGKINLNIYDIEYQNLIDLLININHEKRPDIKEVLNFININAHKLKENSYSRDKISFFILQRNSENKMINNENIDKNILLKFCLKIPKLKKYKEILLDKLSNNNFNIKDQKYNDETKENIISAILDSIMEKLNKKEKLEPNQKEEINKELHEILKRIIQPSIDEETNINILKIINSVFSEGKNLDKIFTNGSSFPLVNNISLENAQKVSESLFDLIIIFLKKKDEPEYFKELKNIIQSIFDLIKNSITEERLFYNSNDNEKNFTIIYLYQLIYKLLTTKNNEIILLILIRNNAINMLIHKLEYEKEEIRKVIYDCLIYLVKQTDQYKKEFFELKEGEKDFYDFKFLKNLDINAILLFEEKKDLLFMLLTIFEHNNYSATSDSITFTFKLFDLYESKDKLNIYLEDLLYLILTQAKINDSLSFKRLNILFGYPSLVIKDIPRKKKMQNNDDDDNEEKINQKWPIFGEKLINGDINKHIYRYKNNINRKKNICLLNLLFPYKDLELDNDNKEKEKDDFSNANIDNNYIKNDDYQKKNVNLVISDEIKRKILLNLINNCFGELNNYTLFKYIYLMPARSLLYKNLYEEIMTYLKDEESLNFEKIKEKEEMYIKNIEKEINKAIEKAKKRDKELKESKHTSYRYNSFSDTEDEDENENNDCPLSGRTTFKCFSKEMKNFIGFNSDIIAGDIIREEISELSVNGSIGLYRIKYFTKYYNVDALRNLLLNNKDKKKIENANINENISEKENKKKEKDIGTEINEDLDEKSTYKKYDISQVNENSLIYKIFKKEINSYVLEDNSIKDRDKVKSTLLRYYLVNESKFRKQFKASFRYGSGYSYMGYLGQLNFFSPEYITDEVKENNISVFNNLYRLRDDLPFLEQNINISIDLNLQE